MSLLYLVATAITLIGIGVGAVAIDRKDWSDLVPAGIMILLGALMIWAGTLH